MAANSINLSLTRELREFVDRNSGDGSDYATPSEFLRDLLREKKRRMEAATVRDSVIEGYRDLTEGRVVEFKGSLEQVMSEARSKDRTDWK